MSSKDTDVYRSLQGLLLWTTEKVEKSQTFSFLLKLSGFLSPCANHHYLLLLGLPVFLVILVLGGITLFELCYIYSTRYSLQVILNSNAANLQPSELHIPRSLLGMQRSFSHNPNITSSAASNSYLTAPSGPDRGFMSSSSSSSSYLAKLARSDHLLLASSVQMPSLVLSHYFEIERVVESFEQPLLFWTEMARFGNHIFQYAAAYVTAKKTGHIPCISGNSDLLALFGNIKALPVKAQVFRSPRFPVVKEEKTSVFLPSLVDSVRGHKNVKLQGYFQSWKYLLGYERDIRDQFRIRDDISETVTDSIRNLSSEHLHTLKTSAPTSENVQDKRQVDFDSQTGSHLHYNLDSLTSPDNFTLIGVHVRRGDLDTFYFRWRGMRPAPITYIDSALSYYRAKYPRRLFLVCSDDIRWCEENISNRYRDVIFVKAGGYRQDFALLTRCHHSVITSGSFGWWSAWLTGGDVVYYSGFPAANTSFGAQYNKDDYYPPTWKPMP